MEYSRKKYRQTTLVDYVEESIIDYMKSKDLNVGDSLPSEAEMCCKFGVARSVLREGLSRLKMLGLIESHPSRGMAVKEPNIFEPMRKIIDLNVLGQKPILDILQLRIALEIGMVDNIFEKLTDEDIYEMGRIVNVGIALEDNLYEDESDIQFHSKLYEITRNQSFLMFQDVLQPVMVFVKKDFSATFGPINRKLRDEGRMVTHSDLYDLLKKRDKNGFRIALENHFLPYKLFLNSDIEG